MIATASSLETAAVFAGSVLGLAISSLLYALVSSFVAALFVGLSVRWIVSRRIGYWYAYWTSVIAQLLCCAVAIPLAFILIVVDKSMPVSSTAENVLTVLSPVIAFAVYTPVYGARFLISLRKAALVVLIQCVLTFPAAILLVALILLSSLLVSLVA